MSLNRRMRVRMEPSLLRLQRGPLKLMHSVGEILEIQTAQATLTVIVLAEDAVTHSSTDGVVHLGGEHAPTNQSFSHTFSSELNEETGEWSKERLWVECSGYESAEILYSIEVD
jgi:hypothetical protein